MNLRSRIFWLLDYLRGSRIKREYNDVKNVFYGHSSQENAVTEILKYAIREVPFYSNIKDPILSEFPVMSKKIYKEQKSACYSREYPALESLYKASTSGSTGTPLVVYQDQHKRLRHRTEYLFFNEHIGWNLGDHYVFIRNWVSNYHQSRIKNIAQNVTNISISEFDDEKKKWLCKHLKRRKHSIVFGYSSSICDFMRYVNNHNIQGKELFIKLIVCDSDELTNQNKSALEKTFQCPVINRYDNEENGLIATTLPNSNTFVVNYPNLYIELLKLDSDQPVAPGEVGRVVVTDLFNHAMPLIRYDLGDYAISFDEEGAIKTLAEFSGRKADCIYSTKGLLISNVAISCVAEIFTGIEKYQIVQEDQNKYLFKYVGALSEEENEDLYDRLLDCLGKDADIRIENHDNIESGKNGKYKPLVNNFNMGRK